MASVSTNPFYLKTDQRQRVMAAHFELALSDFANYGSNTIDLQGPDNSQVVGGDLTVDTAFNTTGTDTLAIGDADVANRYLAATNIKATGRTALTPTGFKYTDKSKPFLRLTRTPADSAATTGVIRITVLYVTLNKGDSTEG